MMVHKDDLIAKWFDPRNGEFKEIGVISSKGIQEFNTPDENDWLLYINLQK